MKKLIFTVSTILIGSTAMAQGLYGSVNVGYGLGLPAQVLGTDYEITSTGSETRTNINGTLGAGLNFGITPGYMFSEHFGVELGINYFMGSKIVASRTKTPFGTAEATAHSNQLRLLPALVVSSGGDKFKVYAKAGLVLPVIGTTFTKAEDTGAGGPGTGSTRELETKGSFSIGFNGVLGVNYGLSEKLSLFAELSGMNLNIAAKEREVVTATNNGTDVMGFMKTYDKKIVYVDELTSTSNNAAYNANYTQDQAQEVLKTRNNFSALFINLGVKFNF